jgi:hypothetical protein
MLDLALEDLQRATSQGRELLQQHPERAHAALDLLLINVGVWEVRWLGMANASVGVEQPVVTAEAESDETAVLDLAQATEMSTRARELIASPGKSKSRSQGELEDPAPTQLHRHGANAASELHSHAGG